MHAASCALLLHCNCVPVHLRSPRLAVDVAALGIDEADVVSGPRPRPTCTIWSTRLCHNSANVVASGNSGLAMFKPNLLPWESIGLWRCSVMHHHVVVLASHGASASQVGQLASGGCDLYCTCTLLSVLEGLLCCHTMVLESTTLRKRLRC